jgi:hypothetical protein
MSDLEQSGPGPEIVNPIREAHPHRAVAVVTLGVAGTDHHFVMTSPNRDERKKYIGEMKAANNDSDKIESAIEKAALAQIRWPARDVVVELFNNRPGIILHFADELAKLDGTGAEVRSKNY